MYEIYLVKHTNTTNQNRLKLNEEFQQDTFNKEASKWFWNRYYNNRTFISLSKLIFKIPLPINSRFICQTIRINWSWHVFDDVRSVMIPYLWWTGRTCHRTCTWQRCRNECGSYLLTLTCLRPCQVSNDNSVFFHFVLISGVMWAEFRIIL